MTFPVWIPIGPWTVHPHAVFETLGYLIGFRLYLWRRARNGDHIADHHRWSIVTAAAVGAVVGSRLLFWLEDPAATVRYLQQPAVLLGGKTVVGALLGGWIAVETVKRFLGVRESSGDLFVLPLAIGMAIGRVGCFLSGLPDGTYGTETTLPWGVDLGDGVRRHPVALYESVFLVMLAIGLTLVGRRMQRGDVFKLFMTAYLGFRLFAEAIKPGVTLALGLTAIQWACMGGLGYYAWWYASGRPRAIDATAYPGEAQTS